MIQNCKTLDELWEHVTQINLNNFPENELMPIFGNGKTLNPEIMFVFINPTARNISSGKSWKGPRFPFIGTKQVWRVFHKAGLLDDRLMEKINSDSNWSLDFTSKVLDFFKRHGFYFTNIVKHTGKDATLPDSKKINMFLPVLLKEIEIVQPKHIITFGLMPFEKLTKQKIKLSEYHKDAIKNKKLKYFDLQVNSVKTKVIPCYFPVGRGSPKKANDILRLVKTNIFKPQFKINNYVQAGNNCKG